jgi:hypothetical protein
MARGLGILKPVHIAGCNGVDPVGLLFGMAHLTGTLSAAWTF